MKGKVDFFDPKKKIGFIQPEGTTDKSARLFFHVSVLTSKDMEGKVGEGSEVEFEADTPGPKGPRAKSVNILTAGKKPSAKEKGRQHQDEIHRKEKEEPKYPPNLEVDSPLDPDDKGRFWVSVLTRENGQFAPRKFRITAPLRLVIKNTNGELLNPDEIETSATGRAILIIKFKETRVTLTFTLDDGNKEIVDLVK